MDIAQLRQEYMRAGLAEADADPDPLRQFDTWFADALKAALPLPNAMTLATVTASGAPSARTVLLKGVDGGGFVFYTNYRSRKARELESGAGACLSFLWSALERQVHVSGSVERVSAAESDAYYASRPLGARHSAWASPQSEVVAERSVLERRVLEIKREYGDNPPRPAHWGGYRVMPREIEFWQGRADRLHDRLRYARAGGGADGSWRIERLAP